MHNVHAVPKNNREFNFSQPANVPPVDRVFTAPEIGIPVKCDVHGWMNAYANVVPHPVLRGDEGRRQLRDQGPAAGHLHASRLWHETLGTQTQSVTVDGETPAKVTAVFKPATLGQSRRGAMAAGPACWV